MQIGFVGLGIMGRPMVLNLLRGGYRVHVWSRRAESMTPLIEAGAIGCGSAAEVAASCEIVISMVADAPDVEQVALGERGVVEGARPGLLFIDMSTIAPSAARRIALRLEEYGVEMLDAPVSGGETGAINAALTIMAGGSQAAFDKALPVLQCLGKKVTHVGANGAGQVAKACNQILTGAGVLMVAEALNFARASGVEPAKVREAMLGGSAHSRVLENHGQRMLERNFNPGFKAWMHRKDLKIVLDEAHRLGVMSPVAAITAQMFNALVGGGDGERDSVAMLQLLERMSGVDSE
ncbi:2-hydroxy-3-oxopropionate reductase [Formivibrio citricus]|uniref:2-hydroxy-3-oxopropionate reductase n=1 Tax=Formivibrio citricus TaxID=83765 RepID=A0A1I4WRD5_9NEIS|nr:NAD(P)-dependent oxidoreductase [Formivibrio citricus]SFN16371.1 2-hydroxy-3-oxopropionate reductase [Formivibrio citricus]